MHKRVRRKKVKKKIILGVILGLIIFIFFISKNSGHHFEPSDNQSIDFTIVDDGQEIKLENVEVKTVLEAVKFYDENISENDRIFPTKDSNIFSEDVIRITREKIIKLKIDDEELEIKTFGDTLENIFIRENIDLDENDLVIPNKKTLVQRDMEVEIIKVEIKEEAEIEKIPFETINKDDNEVSFLKKYTKTEGEKGKKEIIYEISYHNGEEVERKKIEENIIKEPVDEVIVQGTRMKLGKAEKGSATWYAHTGTLACASRDHAKGTYLKVTNQGNGKSVVVIVNDYGPADWTGHIIDLDKVAFAKIASIGAGVVGVKVERILE